MVLEKLAGTVQDVIKLLGHPCLKSEGPEIDIPWF